MTRRRESTSRRAYALLLALGCLALSGIAALILVRLALIEVDRERGAMLESTVVQIAESAKSWTLPHAGRFDRNDPIELPIGALLPPSMTGRAALRRLPDARGREVECHVTLTWGGRSLDRRMRWTIPEREAPSGP
jgi:hypothetical protein